MKFLDEWHNKRLLKRLQVEFEVMPTINGRLQVYHFCDNPGRFKFGKNVVINSCVEANPVGGSNTCFVIKGDGALIEIDDNAGLSNVIIGAREHVYIGKNVNLGGGVKIFDNDFHSLYYEKRVQDPDPDIRTKPVRIEDGAFVGADAIILKGVTIGKKSVLGAGSVLARSIPDGELWGGNPAQFIKKLYE
jgi:acetyltransferase-like isoleucine patch superfamily enzyme